MDAFLALDAGTGGAKAAVFDASGRLLGCHAQPWQYEIVANAVIPVVKEYSFDADEFWRILCASGRAALAAAGPCEVLGVACTSQREGCVFLDAKGQALYAGPNLDSRAFMEGLEVLEHFGAQRLYEITGHSAPFIFPLVRYLWFRKHDNRAVAHLLMINDWMSYRLCGELASEPSNAAESMLFDFRRRDWSEEILSFFSIPKSVLPPLRSSGERLGGVGRDAAEALGIAAGTPVFVGGADTQCALLGAGAIDVGDTGIILGTTSPLQMVLDRPTLDPAANLWAGCHVVGGRWVLESNMGSTGDAYRWLLELCAGGAAEPHRRAAELARSAKSDGTLMFIGPRIFDVNKIRPDMPGGILFRFPSLQSRPGPGELLRAFFESIGCAARANLEQIRAVAANPPPRLRIGGGLSRSSELVQTIADVCQQAVERTTNAESSALGCAILVAVGVGAHADVASAVAAMCGSERVEVSTDEAAGGAAGYAKWCEIYGHLESLSI